MDKKFDDDYPEDEDNIYDEDVIEDLEENDEINPSEGAFIEGYVKDSKPKKKLRKKSKKK